MTQDPRNHHYVPKFFIRRWANADDRVWAYRYPYSDKLEIKHLPPSGIGFGRDLYALSGGSPTKRQRIELETTQKIDSEGALALAALLESAGRPLDEAICWSWTEFVAALISRSPSRLEEISRYSKVRTLTLDDAMRGLYIQRRAPDWPETLDEAVAQQRDDAFDKDLGKLTAERLFRAPSIKEAIMNMHWRVRRFDAGPRLLLSDHPVTYGNFRTLDAVVVMPLGPREAFIAARRASFLTDLLATSEERLIATLNAKVLQQARACVFALDRTQDDLIRSLYQPPPA